MNPDQQLSSLLHEWKQVPEPGPGFRRDVWARIEARRPVHRLGGFLSLMAVPRFATAAAVIAVFAGIVAGNLQARSAGEALYLRSVDPLSLHVHAR
jgi:hypothetical protein